MPAPYPRALRSRIAVLNRSSRHEPLDPLVRDVVRQRAADACEYCLMPTTGKFEFAFSPTKGYGVIIGLTPIGAKTIRAMQFHAGGPEGALAERYAAILRGVYPPPWLRAAYHL